MFDCPARMKTCNGFFTGAAVAVATDAAKMTATSFIAASSGNASPNDPLQVLQRMMGDLLVSLFDLGWRFGTQDEQPFRPIFF
jgi:hypothetical protein